MATQKITAWSFSRYMDYLQCPLKAKFKFIDRLKEPDNPAFEKGKRIHKLAEDFAKGTIKTLPADLKLLKAPFTALRKEKPHVELQWAFDTQWKAVEWFGPTAHFRLVLDAMSYIEKPSPVLRMIDHKTGKEYPYHNDQLSLYALGGFKRYPEVQTISSELWYIDTGKVVEMQFRREEESALEKDWKKRTAKMLKDTSFKPTPNDKCRWCHFRNSNGGPCKF